MAAHLALGTGCILRLVAEGIQGHAPPPPRKGHLKGPLALEFSRLRPRHDCTTAWLLPLSNPALCPESSS